MIPRRKNYPAVGPCLADASTSGQPGDARDFQRARRIVEHLVLPTDLVSRGTNRAGVLRIIGGPGTGVRDTGAGSADLTIFCKKMSLGELGPDSVGC